MGISEFIEAFVGKEVKINTTDDKYYRGVVKSFSKDLILIIDITGKPVGLKKSNIKEIYPVYEKFEGERKFKGGVDG